MGGRDGVGVGGGWEAEGGLNQKERAAVSSVSTKTATVNIRTRRSLGHLDAALLVRPSGTIHPTVHELHGQINAACESRPAALSLVIVECGFHVKL